MSLPRVSYSGAVHISFNLAVSYLSLYISCLFQFVVSLSKSTRLLLFHSSSSSLKKMPKKEKKQQASKQANKQTNDDSAAAACLEWTYLLGSLKQLLLLLLLLLLQQNREQSHYRAQRAEKRGLSFWDQIIERNRRRKKRNERECKEGRGARFLWCILCLSSRSVWVWSNLQHNTCNCVYVHGCVGTNRKQGRLVSTS